MRQGFDNAKYIELQAAHIKERISQFGGKLYLEFGGKLFDDYHASRVLPGFEPDSKFRMLKSIADDVEVIIAINANHIEKNKARGDLGITYDEDVLRLVDLFRGNGFAVAAVVITQYAGQPAADVFRNRLNALGIPAKLHYPIEGYPHDVDLIVSDDGYGKNEFVETTRPLVVVTAPGPGSGKLATCLSQLYHEHKHGTAAGYAKFETFPVWNLPLTHPVNIAYEAATADLDDANIIDSFHLEAYNKTTVNYNRDVEAFPVVRALMEKILGKSPYQSPTDMGVNMVGFAITDEIFAVAIQNPGKIKRNYFMGLTIIPIIGWTLGTLGGALLGNILPAIITNALAVALYGMFIAVVVPKARDDSHVFVAVCIAVAISVALKYIPVFADLSGGFAIIICTVVASLIAAVLFPVEVSEDEF